MAKVVVFDNAVVQQRTNLVTALAKLWFDDKLYTDIDKIPLQFKPKDATAERCCIYKDRHMIKYRILALLGLDVENLADDIESKPLSYFAEIALKREIKDVRPPVLTVIQEACNQCSKQQYLITDACQNCIAKPCKINCPKDAISHYDGRGHIDTSKCIKCGKCSTVCPYHAIINIPIPCISACPAGAITAFPDGRKIFDHDKCISCGVANVVAPSVLLWLVLMFLIPSRQLRKERKFMLVLLLLLLVIFLLRLNFNKSLLL